MNSLEVKVVSKIIDTKRKMKRRITVKDMSHMKLEDIEKSVKELKSKIEGGEVDNYTVNTFTTLCGKAIEAFNKKNDEIKQFEIMSMMKDVLALEQVNKMTEMEQKEKEKSKDGDKKNDEKKEEDKKNEEKKEDEKKEETKKEEEKKNENEELYEDR